MREPPAISVFIERAAAGDRQAFDHVVGLVYPAMRRIAHDHMRRERHGVTLDTSALVHETYLRLAGSQTLELKSRAHFFWICARAMRRVLIDRAARRATRKRGGGAVHVDLRDADAASPESLELHSLEEALVRLAARSERQGKVVECRFFGGMSVEETALALDISTATVKRDWALARAWLNRELSNDTEKSDG
jgi:RNA polymerase sigma factor (TIGR02999 family)